MSDVELSSRRPPIAVIGIACRFPGASNYQTFWENIRSGCDSITDLPPERRAIDGNWPPFTRGAGSRWQRQGGFLDRVDLFDNDFFNISPREAVAMDPQQRLLLEESYRCFEDAGVLPEELSAARTAVFAGYLLSDYALNIKSCEGPIESFTGTGSISALIANRLSFAFGLTGPSFTVNAACASSHVALHEACISLIRDECDLALACAVNLDFNPHKRAFLSHGRFLSPDGRCKAFDKDANGYVPSEGVGAVLLQPLDRALREGRHVYAVIRGSALHHVGRSLSLTAPRVKSQEELLLAAYRDAGVSPATVGYVEAHGTGTSLGDPIEVEALTRAFRSYSDAVQYCSLGSVKSNIGHAEAAAGLAGLIKVVGMLRSEEIHPTLHVKTPNPIIDFESSPFRLALESEPWARPLDGGPRRAAISSLGFGGAGGHIIVDEFPGVASAESGTNANQPNTVSSRKRLSSIDENDSKNQQQPADLPRIFLLSAKSRASLQKLLEVWVQYTASLEFEASDLDDICGTLLARRVLYEFRFVVLVRNHSELKERIAAAAMEPDPNKLIGINGLNDGSVARRVLRIGAFDANPQFILAFRRQDPPFHQLCDRVEAALDSLYPEQAILSRWLTSEPIDAKYAQALNCALLWALARRLCEGGNYRPDLIYGEGTGRLVAYTVAGMLELEQALKFGQQHAWLPASDFQSQLKRPHTLLQDARLGFVYPLSIQDGYLSGLLADLSIEPAVLDKLKRKAVSLSESQHTFKAFLRKWEPALGAAGAEPTEKLLHAPAGHEDVLCAVVFISCLQRLNQRWGFAEKERFSDARFYEFLDLIDDGVLEPADAVQAVLNANAGPGPEREQRFHRLESRIRSEYLSQDKPYGFMRSRDDSIQFEDCERSNRAHASGASGNFASPGFDAGAVVLDLGKLDAPSEKAFHFETCGLPDAAMRTLWSSLIRAGVESTTEPLLRRPEIGHVALPSYQFVGESYWLEIRSPDTISPVHPLIDENHSSLVEAKFTKTIQSTHHLLSDHQIGGRKLLPAAACIEAARAAGTIGAALKVRAMRDVVFLAPFTLDDSSGEHLKSFELRLLPAGEGLDFEFIATPSLPGPEDPEATGLIEGNDAGLADETGPTRFPFCSGSLEFDASDAAEEKRVSDEFENPFEEISKIKARCSVVHADSQSAYDALGDRDMRYGPSLRSVQWVKAGNREALVYLKQPSAGENQAYILPPAILDGAFQATLLSLEEAGQSIGRTFVPVSIGRLRFSDRMPGEVYVYLRRKKDLLAGRMTFDIFLGSESGELLAVVEDFALQALSVSDDIDASESQENNPEQLYSFEMVPAELTAGSSISAGEVILFTNNVSAMRSGFLTLDSGEPTIVAGGSRFEQVDARTVRLDPEDPNHYANLLEVYPEARTLVICPDFHKGDDSATELFLAARALQSAKHQTGSLALFRLVVDPRDVMGRAFAGFARSLRRENPLIDCAVLDFTPVNPSDPTDSTGIVSTLMREIAYRRTVGAVRDCEVRVMIGDGKRFARRWRPITAGAPDHTNNDREDSAGSRGFKQNGIYLITGGAGGLGRSLAKFLVERCEAHVILCGRSAGPVDLSFAPGERVEYAQADLTRDSDVRALVDGILSRHGALHGVIHAAGVLEDALLVNKDLASFQRVLDPKIRGVENLDAATRELSLDFFVSFSSIVAGLGNAGQCDYALANAYLEAFTERREKQREAGDRSGRSLSIGWPYWKDGGMRLSPELEAALESSLGVRAISAASGLRAFEMLLAAPGDFDPLPARVYVASRGDTLPAFDCEAVFEPGTPDVSSPHADSDLTGRVERDLIQIFARELRTSEQKVVPDLPFSRYGVDSLLIVRLNATLEKKFGKLSKTLFFEYSNLRDLAQYFVSNYAAHYPGAQSATAQLPESGPGSPVKSSAIKKTISETIAETNARKEPNRSDSRFSSFLTRRSAPTTGAPAGGMDIAIIGMSGRYPGADNLEEYWRNLSEGRDCITEIPPERWPADLFDADKDRAGKSYSRWGGFVSDADCFDPLFFNISPFEATRMDPQERLFLQTIWNTLEDAGYTPQRLAQTPAGEASELRANAGVFVGVMWGDYQLFGVQEALQNSEGVSTSRFWSIANRVSYVLDLHGPSMAVDTACSSSLTAIHLACESLLRGETRFAIAGGVNLSLHPYKYIQLSRERFLASDGRCRSFGEGGDGYVPGEGVGAVLLRPLAEAEAAGDRILGVIKGTAINHGGTTNGYTVPSPNAQGELILKALRRAGVDPKTLGYIEAHGTGTSLGDPIEIAGLARAFREYRADPSRNGPAEKSNGQNGGADVASTIVPIGSVKSNIGHLESAAGIAGVTKVLLQMRAGQIAPSLMHSDALNPNIDFEVTPFRVQKELTDWNRKARSGQKYQNSNDRNFEPRRAAISSFGAGGSNGHVIIEEYIGPNVSSAAQDETRPQIVPLSARTPERLRDLARQLHDFFEERIPAVAKTERLQDIAHTIRMGRVALAERLVFVVRSIEELRAALWDFLNGAPLSPNAFAGHVESSSSEFGHTGSLQDSPADREFLKLLAAAGEFGRIAAFWADGATVHWPDLFEPGRSVGLPVYPFARERYWLPITAATNPTSGGRLHPLLDANVSTLYEEKFVRKLSGDDFVIRDHRLRGRGLLPGAAYLEMARAAAELACETAPRALRSIIWEAPLFVSDEIHDARNAGVVLFSGRANQVEFEVRTETDGLHAHGIIQTRADTEAASSPQFLDVAAIESRTRDKLEVDALYSLLSASGLGYGPSFRWVKEIHCDGHRSELLARLRLPDVCDGEGFVLHPGLLDGAFQCTVALISGGGSFLPYAIEELRWNGGSPDQCLVHIVRTAGDDSEQVFEIKLANESGEVWAVISGFSLRAMSALPVESAGAEVHFFAPRWIASAAPVGIASEMAFDAGGAGPFTEGVLLLSNDDALATAVPANQCLRLRLPGAEQVAGVLEPELARDRVRRVVLGPDLAEPVVLLALSKFLLERSTDEAAAIGILILSDGKALARSCAGFARTLRLERPDFEIALFESEGAERYAQFARAIVTDQADVEVRLQDGQLTVREIEALHIEQMLESQSAETGATAEPVISGLRNGGVYLITGGAGGLGLIFAAFLVREFDARVALAGRRTLTDELAGQLAALTPNHSDWTERISYFEADLTDIVSCETLSRNIHKKFGGLNGILHSAGVLRDSLLVNKSKSDFEAVLAPKIQGTLNLDQAFANADLDFLALFSSVASVCGNRGQADYASGNAFLDAFAEERNALVSDGARRGHTISLNWPLWSSGGMTMAADAQAVFERLTGLRALENAAGVRAFAQALRTGLAQVVIAPGDKTRILKYLNTVDEPNDSNARARKEAGDTGAPGAGPAKSSARSDDNFGLEQTLTEMVAGLLKIDPARIRAENALSEYGVDSVALTRYASQLNQRFDLALNPSIFFEHTSIVKFARYLREEHGVRLESPGDIGEQVPAGSAAAASALEYQAAAPSVLPVQASGKQFTRSARKSRRFATENAVGEIAIVGLHCNFPGAADPTAFWDNIVHRRDMIGEVSADRWDWRKFAGDPLERNRSVSRWGGFVADIDKFDPLFFGLSPHEAELMDPQQRILLETVWKTVEDAGYRASDLAERPIGLFVGVSTYDYMRRIDSNRQEIDGYFSTGNTHSIIANRISYLLNLRGPSQAVDTACSSSLVALHNALRALQSGDCEAALVGGVNALTDPDLYISFSKAGMLSPDGRCKTFDREANGYVRGEGAGAVFLKPLERALADGDQIYGVIRGSAVNHGGRAQSLTAPNPAAQAELLVAAYRGADISPDSVSYIEAHGTGTALGDPIEINGLKQAFADLCQEYRLSDLPADSCALGSVKTSIGHLEAAAGMAGLIKVLLMFRHRTIPGNVNFNELNPYIDFKATPFFVAAQTRSWQGSTDYPLRAGVSSFGFGGANAHLILEEFVSSTRSTGSSLTKNTSTAIIPLSAQDATQLMSYAVALRDFVAAASANDFDLDRIAYTLQAGREAFADRLAIVANSREALLAGLAEYLAGRTAQHVYAATAEDAPASEGTTRAPGLEPRGTELAANPGEIAASWVRGAAIHWDELYGAIKPIRMSLPTYPFRRERYWIGAKQAPTGEMDGRPVVRLHPLIDANVSTLDQPKFIREVGADEYFIRDHRLEGRGLFPGTAYLEMARAAAALACESDIAMLRDIVWEAPLFVGERSTTVELFLYAGDAGDACEFEIETADYGVHAHGVAEARPKSKPAILDLAPVRHRLSDSMAPALLYERLSQRGLEYGPAFRCVTGLWVGDEEALIEITAPPDLEGATTRTASNQYRLHPALLDAAVHATACLFPVEDEVQRSFVPAALESLRIFDSIPARCFAYLQKRTAASNHQELVFDLKLISPDDGAICVELAGLHLKARARNPEESIESKRIQQAGVPAQNEIHYFHSQFVEREREVIEPGSVATPAGDLLVYDPAGAFVADDLYAGSGDSAELQKDRRIQVIQDIADLTGILASGEFGQILFYDTTNGSGDARQLLDFFRFARAVARAVKDRAALIIYCREERILSGQTSIVQPNSGRLAAAGAAGFLRALNQENPQIRFRVISGENILKYSGRELPGRGPASHTANGSPVFRGDNDEIRYVLGKRQAREIRALAIPGAPASATAQNTQQTLPEFEPALREGGVYLITGGTGGLGRIFAQYLSDQYGARVVVLGRNIPTVPDLAGEFIQCDVSDEASLESALREVKAKYGVIHGVLHAAGCIADEFFIRKSSDDVRRVLAPKVTGALNLDRLLADEPLDLFILFSSVAGVAGNAGQSDYGAANAFLNEFAVERNRLREAGERSGRTLSIAWPLWESGGMTVDTEIAAGIFETTGLAVLAPEDGLRAFAQIVAGETAGCVVVAPGDRRKIAGFLGASRSLNEKPNQTDDPGYLPQPGSNGTSVSAELRAGAERYFQELLAREVKLPVHRLAIEEPFQKFGIDSVMIVRLNRLLSREFGSIPKTLFFEYGNLKALTGYFLNHHAESLAKLTDADIPIAGSSPGVASMDRSEKPRESQGRRQRGTPARAGAARYRRDHSSVESRAMDIAIIGMSGRYPGADDLEEYWRNLREGRDCIVEIPQDRWGSDFFDSNKDSPAKSYGRWGGFLKDADCFDPLFFNISPREAERMDPQERLFLQTVWNAVEDAGYTAGSISARPETQDNRTNAGVFVGVMWGEYQLFGAGAAARGDAETAQSNYWSIANRISYVMDFHGPSMAVDTACSSSLTAIHLACESLARGETRFAIAGGVNLSLHPYKYIQLSRGRFLASDGRCRSFGEGGDGYVPGEGVGAVLLRPLAEAEAAGDRILGVIKSTAINHGGATNGFTVPNPVAQGELILKALDRAGVDPQTLGYIEAHGTGTSLGDPIEIAGLSRAFREYREKYGQNGDAGAKSSIPIGSVKSNIGHLESAAGIAGITKVLLQLDAGELAPSLMHSEALNPAIDFAETPFRVQRELADWGPGDAADQNHQNGSSTDSAPRRAAISSFGAGGSNAHVIIEEYIDRRADRAEPNGSETQIVPLSARTPERLQIQAARLLRYLDQPTGKITAKANSAAGLADIAFTLREGRVALDERLAFVVRNFEELRAALRSYIQGESSPRIQQGSVAPEVDAGVGLRLTDASADREFIKRLHADGQQNRVAALWAAGALIDWSQLYAGGRRVSLPTYPFSRERYWIQNGSVPHAAARTPADSTESSNVADRTCLVREWRESPLPPESNPGRSLLVLVGERHGRAVRKALEQIDQQDRVIFRAGSRTGRRSIDEYDVNFRDAESVQQSLSALREAAGDRFPDTIIDLLDTFDSDPEANDQAAPDEGRVALYQAFLEHQPKSGLILVHITRCMQSFLNDAPHMSGALWNGFMRVFGAEYSRVRARTIDLGRDDFVSPPELMALASREAAQNSGEVCYRNGRCYETYFREQPLLDSVRIAPDGVYVISGGTRGLGAAFARRLVVQGARKLVLLGRETLPDRDDWRRLLDTPEANVTEATLQKIRLILELEEAGAQIRLYSGALDNQRALTALFRTVRRQWGDISGVLHCAGLVSEENPAFIHKNYNEISRVLEPKTSGTRTLARVLAGDRPDFFVLFSSVSACISALGVGLSDYAAANSYLDFFAAQQYAQGRHYFKSINWPSWTDTGFGEVASDRYRRTGLLGLPTAEGLELFERTVNLGAPVIVPALVNRSIFRVEGLTDAGRRSGEPAKQSSEMGVNRPVPVAATAVTRTQPPEDIAPVSAASQNGNAGSKITIGNQADVKSKLKELLSKELKLPLERFEDDRNFSDYGVDSVLLAAVVRKIERWLDRPFDPSSMLEHPTLARLGNFIARTYSQGDSEPSSVAASPPGSVSVSPATQPASAAARSEAPRIQITRTRDDGANQIAVIGMACTMPGANDVTGYWRNLSEGRSSIIEVPPERWDVNEFYSPEGGPGKSISKWGGFIEGAGLFDAHYFGIDEALALQMDPMQRLSLENGLLAILDAGYEPGELAGRRVGVYVGARSGLYMNRIVQPDRNTVIGVGQNFIAARMSDYFNFSGNNLVIDTACSSSLVSLHLACQALNSGEEQLAMVGGVDLLLDEMSYLSLSAAQALSPDGKCHTFDVNANGFVPGEGCGMMLLKPLDRAMQDGDRVYAVIRGSAVNNDGRTMGITTPNVDAQMAVIHEALERAGISPETISCLETHGTGTMIGDPIELKALTNVFRKHTAAREFCAVGSVKTNIGHLLSAAGIASAIKIALSLHHQKLPPTLNCETPNPRFAFSESPFFPNTALQEWKADVRRAGISSFGFGGTNCHLIMEQLQAGNYVPRRSPLPVPEFKKKSYWLPKRPVMEPATNGHDAASSTIQPLMALERVQVR